MLNKRWGQFFFTWNFEYIAHPLAAFVCRMDAILLCRPKVFDIIVHLFFMELIRTYCINFRGIFFRGILKILTQKYRVDRRYCLELLYIHFVVSTIYMQIYTNEINVYVVVGDILLWWMCFSWTYFHGIFSGFVSFIRKLYTDPHQMDTVHWLFPMQLSFLLCGYTASTWKKSQLVCYINTRIFLLFCINSNSNSNNT